MNWLILYTFRVRYIGSAALSLAYIAKGALDCLQMDNLCPWDVAAGVLLVREAGGTVIDTKGIEIAKRGREPDIKIKITSSDIQFNIQIRDEYRYKILYFERFESFRI